MFSCPWDQGHKTKKTVWSRSKNLFRRIQLALMSKQFEYPKFWRVWDTKIKVLYLHSFEDLWLPWHHHQSSLMLFTYTLRTRKKQFCFIHIYKGGENITLHLKQFRNLDRKAWILVLLLINLWLGLVRGWNNAEGVLILCCCLLVFKLHFK